MQALIQANIIDGSPCVAFMVGNIHSTNQDGYIPTERIIGTKWERGDFGLRSGTTAVVGNTKESSNIPPYVTVNMWKRIA